MAGAMGQGARAAAPDTGAVILLLRHKWGSVMLDRLFETIETLKARIKEHGDYFHAGGKPEARTRAALIDPMLSALEWDVTDPGLVEIEPKTIDGWADYALLGSGGNPVFFIEAKKLADRNPDMAQVVGYIIKENAPKQANQVRYGAWTNGDTWEVYDTREHNVAMKLSISDESTAQCALNFLFLWRRSMRDGRFFVPFVDFLRPDDTPAEPSRPEPESPARTPSAPDGPIRDTYQALRGHLLALGDDVQEKKTSSYVAFKRQRNFALVVEQKQRIVMYLLTVDPNTIDLEEGFSRRKDRSPGGHRPCVEVTIRSREDLRRAEPLLKKYYDAAG